VKYHESDILELKREYTPDIKKEVVAFANTDGGEIYIGISDDGSVAGVAHPDKVLLQITSAVRDGIKPDITMFTSCKVRKIDGKSVIVISVARGTGRPYYLTDKGLKPSGVYVRHATASYPASEEAIRRMIKETDGDKFESTRSINQELTFDFASKEFAKRKIAFGEAQMITLGIKNSNGLFTNLGLLWSDQCVHTLKVACFEGTNKNVFKDRREFTGSVLLQFEDAYNYIDMHNKLHARISGLYRVEYRDYPEIAIREALLNAVIHREYSFSGSVLVNIYDDRIEFVSLGGLVSGLSLDDVLVGVSQSRNEKLSGLFYRLKLIEAYGTGITKIMTSYKESITKPVIRATNSAFSLSLPIMGETADASIPQTEHKENQQWNKIIKAITKKGSVTRLEVQELLGVGQTRAIIILKEMLKQGVIKIESKGRNRRYFV